MKRMYNTIALTATVIAWRGASNHSAEEIADLKSTAVEHDVIAKMEGESVMLMGFNGTHIVRPGDYAVFREGFYESVPRAALDVKYVSDDPFPEPESTDGNVGPINSQGVN